MTTERIAEDADYEGIRAKFRVRLGTTRIAMQVDIGFSDVITPGAVKIIYPTILDHSPIPLCAYNRETVVAEKLEAMVKLGELNSRMKDFFDIWLLAGRFEFDGQTLADAVPRTFERRQTQLEPEPICLSEAFAMDSSRAVQWKAFIRRGRLSDAPAEFSKTIEQVRAFLQPLVSTLAAERDFDMRWPPGGPRRR